LKISQLRFSSNLDFPFRYGRLGPISIIYFKC
jgi:hypothetical protein